MALRALCLVALLLGSAAAIAQSSLPSIAGVPPAASAAHGPLSIDQQMGFSKGFVNSMREQMANLKAAKHLPVRGLVLIETKDGKTFLVSEDGRLAIMGGKWIDLWEKKQITSVEDSVTLDRINFTKLGIDAEEITSLHIGTGTKRVVVFADPIDKDTKGLVSQISPLSKEYTFQIVLVPRRSGESNKAIAKLACAPDKPTALAAFMSGGYASLPEPTPSCDYLTVSKGMSTAVAIRIPGLPLVVREDGHIAYGPKISLSASLNKEAR